MNGQQYFTQPDGQGIVFPEEVGPGLADPSVPRPGVVTRTQTPVTRTYRTPLRKIGRSNPGVWGDIKGWWSGLKPEYRYGIVGGIGAIGLIIAAVQGKGKSSPVKKI